MDFCAAYKPVSLMKKTLSLALMFASMVGAYAQKYDFQSITDVPCTAVISQGNTGTCWSFSTTSFLEAEIIRKTGKTVDLSEMYNVRETYEDKAFTYLMRQGHAQFGEGGLAHDVINSARKYGVVPQSVFSGMPDGGNRYDHSQLVGKLESVLKQYATSKTLSPQWRTDVATLLDASIGKPVTSFTYEGTTYTPKTFLSSLKLNLDDYVTITSFTHEAPYQKFILDVPDNFSNGSFYNLPLDEYIDNIDNALANGYSVALDADVSEPYFFSQQGVAVVPASEGDYAASATEIRPEQTITPDMRQTAFENYSTTDDHLMLIVGKAKDQNGNLYYKVKNSWGSQAGYQGFFYMSVSYIRLKSISVLVSRDALLKKTRKALAI